MKIPLDRQSDKPLYLQICDRIRQFIQTSSLKPGDKLPSIRSLAATIQVNKLTIIEAYGRLEADGFIQARQGAGYFVTPPVLHLKSWQSQASQALVPKGFRHPKFAPKQEVIIPEQGVKSFSETYAVWLQARTQPDIINLGSGFPAASNLEDMTRIARRAMQSTASFFQPGEAAGDDTLRHQITQQLIQQGLEVSAENLIVTNGSMQALALILQQFVEPGDWIIVESPTFHGFLSQLRQANAQIIGIPMTAEGMNLDLLERYLQSHHPKLIYTISSLHNPTGITTSITHRQKLLSLAEQYDCLIIEDNAYEQLSFGITPVPIKAFDQQDRVIYINTFSKTLMPGLRVGYMIVTGNHYPAMVSRKLLQDFHASSASQAIVREYLASGHYRRHLKRTKTLYEQQRDLMLQALKHYFPSTASWTIPDGGIFLWVQLPDEIPLTSLCRLAADQKILVGASPAFFPDQKGYPALRLNFSLSPESIEKGIQCLGDILDHLISQPAA